MFRSLLKFPHSLLFCCLLYAAAAHASTPVILIVGDSISAGYGLSLPESWPRLLQDRLEREGHSYRVVNASITGDTTQGGLARLPRLLDRHQPKIVVLELGGNDGLRGLSLDATRENLGLMIDQSKEVEARVILAGMQLPPNYGTTYTDGFRDMYPALAKQHGALLVPFLMEGVALQPGMMQSDGIHPSAKAQPVLLNNVWTVLAPALAASQPASGDGVGAQP